MYAVATASTQPLSVSYTVAGLCCVAGLSLEATALPSYPNYRQGCCQLTMYWPIILCCHTITRFFTIDKKRQVWEALRAGRGSGITSVRMQMPDGMEGLKYCPTCCRLDTQQYGEPYWHRVHQIPLLAHCPMHKIPLVTVPIKFTRLSEVFLPLVSIHCQEAVSREKAPWMEPLADMIAALLSGDYAPTVGYNNLHTALLNAGYGWTRSTSIRP